MRKEIELLAPAGDYKSFVGAINAGANAVYISGKDFGARKYANNFDREEVESLISYAHIRNVKVFVTLNTLIFEDELEALFEYADFLVSHKVDALIIQDLGVIEECVKRYPKTEIHASTQMNTYNIQQLKYLKSIGVSRAILARETSINTIKKMKQEVDIDIEVFVHGALCVSYSGNCLLSYKQGGRSGNRGECAQPCRLQYSLYRNEYKITDDAYLLSTKDLMTLDHVKDIVNSGVLSLKVEGRMKKPEYVVATIRAYREAIDNVLDNKPFNLEKRLEELKVVFNRDYTKGYLLNEFRYLINNSFRPNHLGIEVGEVLRFKHGKTTVKVTDDFNLRDGIRVISKSDVGGKVDRILKNGEKVDHAYKGDIVTLDLQKEVFPGDKVHKTQDRKLEDSFAEYLTETYKLTALDGIMYINVDKTIQLHLKTPFSDMVYIESDFIVPEAKKQVQDSEKVKQQFDKFGNTHYYLNDFTVETNAEGFIPNKVLNDLRRDAIALIENEILNQSDYKIEKEFVGTITEPVESSKQLIVKVETEEQLQAAIDCGITEIYYAENIKSTLMNKNHYTLQNRIWDNTANYNEKTVIRDFGGIEIKSDNLIADATLNVTNHFSLYSLYSRGIKRVCLSEENTNKNIKLMISNYYKTYKHYPNLEIVVYGKTEVMLTKYCPISRHEGVNKTNCDLCEKSNYSLTTSDNDKYRIIRDGNCNVKILNSKTDSLFIKMGDYSQLKINNLRLNFNDEDYETTKEVIFKFNKKFIKTA